MHIASSFLDMLNLRYLEGIRGNSEQESNVLGLEFRGEVLAREIFWGALASWYGLNVLRPGEITWGRSCIEKRRHPRTEPWRILKMERDSK